MSLLRLCLGTIYLWMFWPSFNSAITAHGDDQHRTALNTYYSLAACTLATYGLSALTAHDGKLDMVRTNASTTLAAFLSSFVLRKCTEIREKKLQISQKRSNFYAYD